MTDMLAPVTFDGGIQSVLARIATIQAQFAPKATSSSSGSSSTFATALTQAQETDTQNPTGLVNGVTYSASSANVTGADVVAEAETYLGVPYVYAGNGRSGIDCLGLVQQTYKALGMALPRISWQQQKVGTAVPSLAQAQPGDVLYFGNPAYHVAIYLGNNKMIEAPQPGEKVKIANVYPAPAGIRRIVGVGSTAASTVPAATTSSAVTQAASSVALPSGVAAYASIFSADEARYSLPTGLLAAVAHVESGGNPKAVSPAGAEGLMQLMPGTAKSLGVDPLNPTQAVDGAARMLSGLLNKYHGSLTLALAAYNAGPGAVDKYGGVPPYPETQAYVVKVKNAMGIST